MKKLLLTLCCVGLLFAGCSDDDDDNKPPQTNEKTAKEFIQKNKEAAKQEFTFNTSELPKTITLKEKVKVTIPKDALLKNGKPITGEFTLEAYEMLKPSSIILSGTNTNHANGRILETDGFVYLNIKQNGQAIDEYLGKNLIISIPTNKKDDAVTELWTGTENAGQNQDQFAWQNMGEGDINWEDLEENPMQKWNSVLAKNGEFEFSFGKLGWCNCDTMWGNDKELTTITVELTGKVGKLAAFQGWEGDTFVFFAGKGYPVIAQLYTEVNATTVKSYENSMPVGVSGKMVAFSIQDGAFSFASQDITITKDMKMSLELKEVTKQAVTDAIKALDNYSK